MKPQFQTWHLLLLILAGWINRIQPDAVQYLLTENQILREKVGKKRIRFNECQRRRLAIKGKILGRKVLDEIAAIVTPNTILRWHRELGARNWDYSKNRKSAGRPAKWCAGSAWAECAGTTTAKQPDLRQCIRPGSHERIVIVWAAVCAQPPGTNERSWRFASPGAGNRDSAPSISAEKAAPSQLQPSNRCAIHLRWSNFNQRARFSSASSDCNLKAVMNREKPDFIVELGDFKDQDAEPDPKRTLSYLTKAESVLAGFRGRRFHVLGNHDQDSLSKSEFLRRIVNSGIKRGRSYYSFDVKGTHFISLDANYRSDGTDYNRGNFDWTEATIPESEMQWLDADLASHRNRTIVLIHQQLDGEGSYYVKNARAVRAILGGSGRVPAVFQGHRHEGAYSRINGIHYYTLKGLIEGAGAENNAFALVTVDPGGTIHISGYGTVPSRQIR